MLPSYASTLAVRSFACLLPFMMIPSSARCFDSMGDSLPASLVLVKGGTFMMGDVFGEGGENERPVHQVTLSDFVISKNEVTVGQFRQFVAETGYRTSAEAPANPEAQKKIMESYSTGKLTPEERRQLKRELLKIGGTGFWHPERCQWTGYDTSITWRNPGFAQTDAHPVVAVSADDAIQYLNWLSTKAGLPVAFDLATGNVLDAKGQPTSDMTKVRGYRLPTEAEWEYAARERGSDVRFGNGANIARSSAINFRANAGEFPYLVAGEYRKGTTPVGSFAPNGLGLFDMSGNAWEWTGDYLSKYTNEPQTNPCATPDERHCLRGGRWGGDASEARVFSRSPWVRNDRCNNSGFRIARSANRQGSSMQGEQ